MERQMYLRKKGTNEIFAWTELLAGRDDMELVKELPRVAPSAAAPEPPVISPLAQREGDPEDWTSIEDRLDLIEWAKARGMQLETRGRSIDHLRKQIAEIMLLRAGIGSDSAGAENQATA